MKTNKKPSKNKQETIINLSESIIKNEHGTFVFKNKEYIAVPAIFGA